MSEERPAKRARDCLKPWVDAFTAANEAHKKEHRASILSSMPQPRHARYSLQVDTTEIANRELPGDRALRDIRTALRMIDRLGYRRSRQQRAFHEAFLRAAAKTLYREDYDANEDKIRKKNNWDSIGQEVLICCPRRFGKTFSVGMFCAAFAVSVPKSEIGVFSPALRASRKLLDLIRSFVDLLINARESPFAHFTASVSNAETLKLTTVEGVSDDVRGISSYPAGTKVRSCLKHN